MKWGFPFGLTIFFWIIVGFFRYNLDDKTKRYPPKLTAQELDDQIKKVVICVPAHNEALVIDQTITSLSRLVSTDQIFVVSDGSTDQTAAIARSRGCQALENHPGQGKAAALESLMKHFQLFDRFDYILIADADTVFDDHFLIKGLPYLADPRVSVITGYAKTSWVHHWRPNWRMFFVGYRGRAYRVLQWAMMYGQTWRFTNVNPVIPGFASLYRSAILRQLKIAVPDMIIEDFNLAFQFHKKRLGLHAHHPDFFATTQDPDNFADYVRQIRRWNLGFFQAVKKWGFWPSFFWLSLVVFWLEIISYSMFLFLLPVIIIFLIAYLYLGNYLLPGIGPIIASLSHYYGSLLGLFLSVVVIDYLISLFIAFKDKKYLLALYGLGFIALRCVDAYILITTLPKAFLTESSGRWVSPTRRIQ